VLRFPILALVFFAANPAAFAASSVWQVRHAGETVYLGGSFHLLRPSDFPLPAEFDRAFERAERVVFETDVGRMQSPEIATRLMQEARYVGGRDLKDALSGGTWRKLRAHAKENGPPVSAIRRFKPFMAATMLTMNELRAMGVSERGVDLHYYEKAKQTGKGIRALESVDEQIELMAGLGKGRENALLRYTLEKIERIETDFERMLQAWRNGDAETLETVFVKELKRFPEIHEQMLVARNRAWMAPIEGFLDSPETEFVLVGVAHMVGEHGLLTLLKERGYSVERYEAPASSGG